MPVTLLSRRRFLGTLATSVGVLTLRPTQAADANPHRVALLSDTHIGEKAEEIARECNMTDRLRQAAGELARLDPKPACAVINGDLAYRTGTAAEYAQFGKLVDPVREAGIPLHVGLGNHDHFGRFAEGLVRLRPADKPVEGEQVLVVELERVNLFVLDSYDPKNTVGGILGAAQLKWLTAALDARKGTPAVVLAHHPLQFEADKSGKWSGLADANDLWPVLKARPQVKAFVFGHTHTWKLAERDGIHLVNLPAIGYPFAKAEVTGWVDAHFAANGVKLEVRSLDPKHASHGKTAELTWRKA
jgi:Icc protein